MVTRLTVIAPRGNTLRPVVEWIAL